MEGNKIIVESGVIMADLITLTSSNNLSGLEHYVGIPSSVGGALWQNLHFLSPDRKETIFIESLMESAEILDEDNQIRVVDKDFFEFGYDQSILHTKNILVLEATFLLKQKNRNEIDKQIDENLKWRREKHPPLDQFPSCGSVFKKIEGIGAGRLIEKVGLKGHKVGGAQVSEQHANFLVNTGKATAQDVLSLIILIQDKVKSQEGYDLKTEISLVGEF
jgi:UDP-N-acetylmuramate dehydrogenase